MKKVKVDVIYYIMSFIDSVELNVKYILPNYYRFKWISIEKNIEQTTKSVRFTVSMQCKITSKKIVKHYKTKVSAKDYLLLQFIDPIKVDKIESFKDFVNGMHFNVKYTFPSNFKYSWIEIETGNFSFSNEIEYRWTIAFNPNISSRGGYLHARTETGYEKKFSSKRGVKANLIKEFNWYFTPIKKNI